MACCPLFPRSTRRISIVKAMMDRRLYVSTFHTNPCIRNVYQWPSHKMIFTYQPHPVEPVTRPSGAIKTISSRRAVSLWFISCITNDFPKYPNRAKVHLFSSLALSVENVENGLIAALTSSFVVAAHLRNGACCDAKSVETVLESESLFLIRQ